MLHTGQIEPNWDFRPGSVAANRSGPTGCVANEFCPAPVFPVGSARSACRTSPQVESCPIANMFGLVAVDDYCSFPQRLRNHPECRGNGPASYDSDIPVPNLHGHCTDGVRIIAIGEYGSRMIRIPLALYDQMSLIVRNTYVRNSIFIRVKRGI
jgi:hypothetical protein